MIVLADRLTWGEGRYLAVSLDAALERADAAELELIAALFSADALQPPAEGGEEPLAAFVAGSRQHAVGVSAELREGLRESVQIIANEVLDRLREQGVPARRHRRRHPGQEPGPPVAPLPVPDPVPAVRRGPAGARHPPCRRRGLHRRVLHGPPRRPHRPPPRRRGSAQDLPPVRVPRRAVPHGERRPPRPGRRLGRRRCPRGTGLRFEALKADLFDPARTRLIGSVVRPGYDEDDPDAPRYDTRLRDGALYRVLRRLMLSKGGGAGRGGRRGRTERGGFISYAQLGISQLGAVYEGLMSYTGFIADEELYEVAKNGDPSGGSWMIPASKVPDYADEVFVKVKDENGFQTQERVRYRPGSFVYRLAGRDRQTSASYYTPQSLTSVTVQLALEQRVKEQGGTATAAEVLRWRVCEPALGSGAFLNEAIDQLAALYLRLREEETDDPARARGPRPRPAAGQGLHRPAQLLRRRPQRDRRRAGRGLDLAQRHAPRPAGPVVRPAPGPRQLPDRRGPPPVPGARADQGGVAGHRPRRPPVLGRGDPVRPRPPLPAPGRRLGRGRGGEGSQAARPRPGEAARHLAQAAPQATLGEEVQRPQAHPAPAPAGPVGPRRVPVVPRHRAPAHLRTRDQPPDRRLARGRPAKGRRKRSRATRSSPT